MTTQTEFDRIWEDGRRFGYSEGYSEGRSDQVLESARRMREAIHGLENKVEMEKRLMPASHSRYEEN